jgi:hypothetical protein
MPYASLWRDLHRVDVWELLAFPTKWHSISEWEDFLEMLDEKVRNGCARLLAG